MTNGLLILSSLFESSTASNYYYVIISSNWCSIEQASSSHSSSTADNLLSRQFIHLSTKHNYCNWSAKYMFIFCSHFNMAEQIFRKYYNDGFCGFNSTHYLRVNYFRQSFGTRNTATSNSSWWIC